MLRPTHTATRLLACLLTLLCVASVAGQAISERNLREKARLLGVLHYTRLAVFFDDVPAREAFDALSDALGVTIKGRFADDRAGHGIDPEMPITLLAENIDALMLLEMMIEQCEDYEPCAWQLRNGYIEVGTKERLGAPSARETYMYPIADLTMEPPYFVAPSIAGIGGGGSGSLPESVRDFDQRPYATAVLSMPVEIEPGRLPGEYVARKDPDQLAEEIIQGIIQTIEPGNWDYRNPPQNENGTKGTGPRRTRPFIDKTKIASIRLWENLIIIQAPDFVQRQVGGYPPPIPPRRLSVDELLQRSQRASTDRARITVLGAGPSTTGGTGSRGSRP
jgi:hypothetical protein